MTHQRSPGSRPRNRYRGTGVNRSLPMERWCSRNSVVITAQIVWRSDVLAAVRLQRAAQHVAIGHPVSIVPSGRKLEETSPTAGSKFVPEYCWRYGQRCLEQFAALATEGSLSILQARFRLVPTSFVLGVVVAGQFADGFLRLPTQVLDLVLDLVFGARVVLPSDAMSLRSRLPVNLRY